MRANDKSAQIMAVMSDVEIASAIERGVTGQSDLITSLSLAVIGGLLAVLLRVRIHNVSNPSKEIELKWLSAFWVALGLAGVSILISLFLSGMLVQMAPALFSHTFDAGKKFTEQEIQSVPVAQLRALSLTQFFTFFAAVFAGTVFVFRNRK